jgi:methyl-accepting chemotaxis protein
VSKELLKQVDAVAKKADDVFSSVKSVAAGAEVIRENLVQTTGMIRSRAAELDGLLEEVTKSARLQAAEVQYFVESSTRKIEETFDLVQKSIIDPIRELGALLVGFKVGLDVLLGKRRRPVDRFQHDEEMFI